MLDLSRYEGIDWDPEEDPDGNFQHCARPDHLGPNPPQVVGDVLRIEPVEYMKLRRRSDFSVVGPDRTGANMWVVLLNVSYKRGDYLRPVTGWPATARAKQAWLTGRRVGGMMLTWTDD
jgi:hypothetical protein